MMTFEEYLKKSKKDVDEDEMVAAAPAPAADGVVAAHGTTDADVLGKCDHDDCGGFLKKGCFHIPKPVFKKPLSRLTPETPGGKTRKKKTWQNVQLVTDAELDRKTLMSLHEVPEEVIAAFIKKAHMEPKDVEVLAIMYYPASKTFFAKVKCDSRTFFSMFDFDPDKKKFISADGHRYTAAEARRKFKELVSAGDSSAVGRMKLWVVWGSLA